MTVQRPDRLPARVPTVSPPRPHADRRVNFRRVEDQTAHEERVLLARTLDVLAAETDAEARLARLLRLLARTVGARRAAVIADGIERRTAVSVSPGEPPEAAEALATWLDAHAPRSRARRAAAGRAPIALVLATSHGDPDGVGDDPGDSPADPGPPAGPATAADAETTRYAVVPIPTAGDVALGFEFRRAADADRVADRLPPTMARHAAVALALVTSQLASERELAALRGHDAERRAFVSTVAHELRTPLTGLGGYLELILDGRVPDPTVERDFLERSRSIVGSMGELVGDLLELSRLESGTLDLEIGPFSLAEAGSQVAAGLLPIAIERRIQLTTDLPPRLRVAMGDRRRVEQILTNLVANALKFTPSGGSVQIEARFDGPVAVFVVRDDGHGVPDDDRRRIFERFHRMAAHERITGTGLGLPIARDLARQMAGDLDVASVPGAGSAFILVLPGPASVDAATVDAALRDAIVREECELDERRLRSLIVGEAGSRPRARAGSSDAGAGTRSHRPGAGRLRALPTLTTETTAGA